jgi:hypothetical protein
MKTGGSMKTFNTLMAAGMMAGALSSSAGAPGQLSADGFARPGLHDFDFLAGEWHVQHRRLKERLSGSHDWLEFEGTMSAMPIMGGAGNMDDNVLDMPGGAYRAVTVRAFDPKSGLWAIWWLDGRNPGGDLDPPVKGSFQNGVGTFYADDRFEEKPIRVRFLWSHITATTCRWEQAFSPDAGKTWETNWTMEFRRVGTRPRAGKAKAANLLI